MVDFFLNLVKVNEGIDYAFWISICVAYFFIIWFIVCIWVFSDARRRYENTIHSVLFFLFTLLFGPPALIFYIMIRPEHTLEEDYLINLALSGERELKPIYFDGEHGFDIAINLSVQPKTEASDNHKMNMSIQWMPQSAPKIYPAKVEVSQAPKSELPATPKTPLFTRFSASLKKLEVGFRGKIGSLKKAKKEEKPQNDNVNDTTQVVETPQSFKKEGVAQTKRKKKRKKKKKR